MNYPIYIFFGLAPSFIWLLFFLRKDAHPESNPMILKIFFYGMLAAFPSSAEFCHGAEPTESGERLVLVSWATFKDRELFNPNPAYEVFYRDDFAS